MSDNRYYVKRPMCGLGRKWGFIQRINIADWLTAEMNQALHLVLSQIFVVESLEQFPQLIGREPV